MARLFAADAVAGLHHVLVYVFVAHLGLVVFDPHGIQRLVESEVAHDGGDHLVVGQLVAILHIKAVDVEDVVAGDDVALLIHCQTPVGVAVIGEAHVQLIVHHEFLQVLDMSGPAVRIDVVAVGGIVHDESLGAQGLENALGDLPGSAVGHIQTHLDALEAVFAHADQVTDVAVPAAGVVHGAADLAPVCHGDIDLAVDEFLDLQDRFLIHFLTVPVQQLDAVVVVGVVRSGDHDAAVEIIHPCDVGHRRCGGNVHDIGVRAAGHEAGAQRIFKHIAGTPGILADDDPRLLASLCAVIPAQEAADQDGVIIRQISVRLTAETVGSKIFTHYLSSL